ncbi:GntR family transcriptional regulator [Neobacillus bataviensis LMG 21833]|uniref:GntR family transcriptional regulator n=1 Tax=Neobacillus bataviensis LMG 21833 TaxID=1117379 RepID=K6D848_9BACI|nr:FadR/GntR family transcriptional regulator [Neobacillus bataviensis]EKN64263.1 GntR family transcriptional regulator [Neobacillus bataviensis LMG 21833]
MDLKPIQKKRVYQEIIEQIKDSIRSGGLKPGDKLPSERELADRLTVSRNAVREAVSVMESAGLVEILQGIGIFLKEDNHDILTTRMDELLNQQGLNLVELLEVREVLEGQGAYLAASRRTASELKAIKIAYEKMKSAYALNQIAAVEDYEFHIAVVTAAQNTTLLDTVKLFSDTFLLGVQHLRSRSIKDGRSQTVLSEHFEIYQAIEQQDTERAEKAMRTHIVNAKNRYLLDSKVPSI